MTTFYVFCRPALSKRGDMFCLNPCASSSSAATLPFPRNNLRNRIQFHVKTWHSYTDRVASDIHRKTTQFCAWIQILLNNAIFTIRSHYLMLCRVIQTWHIARFIFVVFSGQVHTCSHCKKMTYYDLILLTKRPCEFL